MREPKVGCTCKIHGEGTDRFTVVEVRREPARGRSHPAHPITGVILNTGVYEDISKVYSIRYQPRPASYHRSGVADNGD